MSAAIYFCSLLLLYVTYSEALSSFSEAKHLIRNDDVMKNLHSNMIMCLLQNDTKLDLHLCSQVRYIEKTRNLLECINMTSHDGKSHVVVLDTSTYAAQFEQKISKNELVYNYVTYIE